MSDEKRIPLVLHLTADEYAALLTFTGQIRNEVTPESVLACLRRAHAADRRWRTAVHAARLRLNAEFPVSSEGSTAPAEPRRRHAPAPSP